MSLRWHITGATDASSLQIHTCLQSCEQVCKGVSLRVRALL